MIKKVSKLIGLSILEFEEFVSNGQIQLSHARLIPLLKVGDELALTSIFLSALRLVKEFRESIFSEVKLSKGGKAKYFTEVSFPEVDESRIDGLIIVIVAGVIRDAVFFEMKNKANPIDAEQIQKYQILAKKLGVKNMITVSNQFVADSSQSPIVFKSSKNFSLYHFSWTYIITIAKLLLYKNENKIEDEDQIEIIKEVVAYLENKDSGITGFTQMKPSWKDLVQKINSGAQIKITDNIVEEAVVSWQQKERDMALMLSRELGVLVKTGSSMQKSESNKILNDNIRRLVNNHYLESTLRVKGSVSDITVSMEFDRRTIGMSIKVCPPLDKGTKGRHSWIIKQIENSKKRNLEVFDQIEDELWIETHIKYTSKNIMIKYTEIEKLYDIDKNKDVIEYKIILIKDIGKNFASPKKLVEIIENMLIVFYQGIVQNMKNWERPAPKIQESN
jgi:hypothetical protein